MAPPSLPCRRTLTFFRTTNSFSAVALRATSSSYLHVEKGLELRAGASNPASAPSQVLPGVIRGIRPFLSDIVFGRSVCALLPARSHLDWYSQVLCLWGRFTPGLNHSCILVLCWHGEPSVWCPEQEGRQRIERQQWDSHATPILMHLVPWTHSPRLGRSYGDPTDAAAEASRPLPSRCPVGMQRTHLFL